MDVESRVAGLLASGDETAAASLAIERLGPSVYGYLCALLEEDDARDVFSQWAEDVWRGLPGFRRECTLRAWAFKLAWNAAARYRRDPYRARRDRLPTGAASRLAASAIASSVLHGGRRALLRRLRDTLPPEDETLLVLRIDKELEWEEIAAVLSEGAQPAGDGDGAPPEGGEPSPISSAALRKRFERLKARLAERAREEGLLE